MLLKATITTRPWRWKRGRLTGSIWAQAPESGLKAEGLIGAHNDNIMQGSSDGHGARDLMLRMSCGTRPGVKFVPGGIIEW
eukprot:scaffold11206_cov89-Skeletonema_dohrnii-CCMP3373.AAC.9